MAEEKERELTAAEKKRLVYFNELIERMEGKGYRRVDLTATPAKANLLGTLYGILLSVPFVVLFIIVAVMNRRIEFGLLNGMRGSLLLILIMFVLIVVHELVHGLTWSLFAEGRFKSIEFGVIWKSLNPYCTCRDPLSKKQYLLGAIMPCIVLGIIPSVIAVITGDLGLMFLGALMIMSAGGDLLICKMILSGEGSESSVYLDHPTEIGLVRFDRVRYEE
ncbi:MAG: DUF3267 domain-containing protein [Oscillospiraceae bacterium]|nr:DUF3267 domain-containing protein [Oscillospiraceae bacterium]